MSERGADIFRSKGVLSLSGSDEKCAFILVPSSDPRPSFTLTHQRKPDPSSAPGPGLRMVDCLYWNFLDSPRGGPGPVRLR